MTLQQLKYVVTVAEQKSMNKAAGELFISQPSLSLAVKELEEELGISIFLRNNRGITVTNEGNEFLGYARQLLEQYRLIDEKYIDKTTQKKKFSVSMQHYSFAVKSFVELVKKFGMDKYEFAIHETKTYEVIENVREFVSEIGIIYRNEFNEKVLNKILQDNDLEFVELFACNLYAYMCGEHPLASKNKITLEDLEEYPCLSFDQGENNSFFLAEEVLSTYQYKQTIKVNDRATMLNLMVGLNGYTLCSGIISQDFNIGSYVAVPLDVEEQMMIGYIKRKDLHLSNLANLYIDELIKCANEVL